MNAFADLPKNHHSSASEGPAMESGICSHVSGMQTSYAQDCLEPAEDRLKKGLIDRRSFMRVMSMIAAAPLADKPSNAEAATKELVLINCGGDPSRSVRMACP